MNNFFEFSKRQLQFIFFLASISVLAAVYLFVKAYAFPTENSSGLEVFLGTETQLFTGLFIVDPNTSPADSLELLPGIGKILADRIVAYREENRFMEPIDITNVPGIGARKYEKIKPYLKVSYR